MANEPTGRRCSICGGAVEQNNKRTSKGHAKCDPNGRLIIAS